MANVIAFSVLASARPWNFATGLNNAGSVTVEVGYNTQKSDSSTGGGTGVENNSYTYGSNHNNVGPAESAPTVIGVTPGQTLTIAYLSGTCNSTSGATDYGPAGDSTSTNGIGTGGTPPGTADYTDNRGYTYPTDCMAAANNLSGLNPTTGRVGLIGCFTDASGNIITNSFWDWRSAGGTSTAGSQIILTVPAGAVFLSMGVNDTILSDNQGANHVSPASQGFNMQASTQNTSYQAYGQADSGGALYAATIVPSSQVVLTIFNDGYKGMVWSKTIFLMNFAYFDKAQSTPYSGQLYPSGASFTTSGQGFPVE